MNISNIDLFIVYVATSILLYSPDVISNKMRLLDWLKSIDTHGVSKKDGITKTC